jgi:hypothetical protein
MSETRRWKTRVLKYRNFRTKILHFWDLFSPSPSLSLSLSLSISLSLSLFLSRPGPFERSNLRDQIYFNKSHRKGNSSGLSLNAEKMSFHFFLLRWKIVMSNFQESPGNRRAQSSRVCLPAKTVIPRCPSVQKLVAKIEVTVNWEVCDVFNHFVLKKRYLF